MRLSEGNCILLRGPSLARPGRAVSQGPSAHFLSPANSFIGPEKCFLIHADTITSPLLAI